eukprot:NODE_8646_length_1479_cov_9.582840.p1 GENE.NODE_8646_length_1479_cov_9.582840~~NODE_8646_length_1479_cov_9.582840.p1  ORF type:complete len:376 (-),score=110.94 NODE_8646_length_1479_cov_9.582840:261-1388(-)
MVSLWCLVPMLQWLAALLLFAVWLLLYLLLAVPARLAQLWHNSQLPDIISAEDGGGINSLQVLIEAPLVVVSYLQHRVWKAATLNAGVTWWDDFAKTAWASQAPQGRLSSTALMLGLLSSPRWNTHVDVHTSRALLRHPSVLLEVENVEQPGYAWQMFVHTWDWRFLGEVVPITGAGNRLNLMLDDMVPGQKLHFSMHPYLDGDEKAAVCSGAGKARLPALWLNGEEVVSSTEFAGCPDPHSSMRGQQTLLHLSLQWYVYPLLALRRWLPDNLVRDAFLPTAGELLGWLYGIVIEGYSLAFEIEGEVFKEHAVYCTTYSRASMPVFVDVQVRSPRVILPPATEGGFWVVRVVRKDAGKTYPDILGMVGVELVRAP